jgi:hypothetical protein
LNNLKILPLQFEKTVAMPIMNAAISIPHDKGLMISDNAVIKNSNDTAIPMAIIIQNTDGITNSEPPFH